VIEIGSKKIDTNIFLAPMAGCTDLPLRMISAEHGARFGFFEMLDSNSFIYGPRRTLAMMKTCAQDLPVAAQLVGNDPDLMLRAAERVLRSVNVAFLDINAACPAKKVIKKKAGAYLLRDEGTLYRMIGLLSGALPVPVTVKIRTACDDDKVSRIPQIAVRCEESGAKAIFIHGRTRLQGYSGEVDYDSIRSVKNSVRIPVFGSGNVFSPVLAKKMFDRTGCDGIMVARGALGNPWIFEDIRRYLSCGELAPSRDARTVMDTLKRHLSYIETHNTSRGKIGVMRHTALWYIKSFPNARHLRGDICTVKSYEKMLQYIDAAMDNPAHCLVCEPVK
jgi:nifR3 family TIM-barrel protein